MYPVPSNDGKFKLNQPKKWKVYSVLGVKVKQGNGMLINLSKLSRGMYILKTDDGNIKRLLFN